MTRWKLRPEFLKYSLSHLTGERHLAGNESFYAEPHRFRDERLQQLQCVKVRAFFEVPGFSLICG